MYSSKRAWGAMIFKKKFGGLGREKNAGGEKAGRA